MDALLLITGAGASRNLGANENPMPLMPDWSNALCEALDEAERGLAAACGLEQDMTGPHFEECLGLLLRWDQMRYLEKRFRGLGTDQVGGERSGVVKARDLTDRRMNVVKETVNRSLYDQFGQPRVDDKLAATAYKSLLKQLGDPELILATTNYDHAGESALTSLGHEVDDGFRDLPRRTPKLAPVDMIANRGSKTPVIHLHGAVGWYEKDGNVVKHYPDQPYNPSLGTPVVLYPDPEKDPTSDAVASELWTEFRRAITNTRAILVLGHSLHDPMLVRFLREERNEQPLAVSYFTVDDKKQIEALLPAASTFKIDFSSATKLPSSIQKELRTAIGRQPLIQ